MSSGDRVRYEPVWVRGTMSLVRRTPRGGKRGNGWFGSWRRRRRNEERKVVNETLGGIVELV